MRGQAAVYHPAVFDTGSFKQAREIILTAEGIGMEERWELETPWISDLAIEKLGLSKDSTVLDYGCGVGRLARALIKKVGCRVVGVDISATMRSMAVNYVNSDRFTILAPGQPIPKCDVALAVWVLQHCQSPDEEIETIRSSLKPLGKVFIVNGMIRALPLKMGRDIFWADDSIDIRHLLKASFVELESGHLPIELAPLPNPQATWWATFEVA